MSRKVRITLLLAAVVTCFGVSLVSVHGQQNTDALRWRYIGPVGNRTTSIVGVPGQPYVYYAGSASGGIFKTIDDRAVRSERRLGRHRRSVDSQSHLSWAGNLQICRRGQDVEIDGPGKDRPHRAPRH